ncbi:purine-nucleoside phosphorylase [Mycoplasmoides fastidiosum]|uniref:Uridine phosphorylase n=1 Tax=Mycoplasmoides fastidiosum TaxID=92758 RepID=A0ABU0LZ79_9BACT|nr:purine-nucleoside phosphorylase [Mycoplasmoides fastidiosum]MDQ0514025.1 purine-nucleoside phosphorylase [Mycoplasmoides fastidiosum]UUD37565.1 purine-nucleoside phosphorylase [Mycoplasmoides fastidiosum]
MTPHINAKKTDFAKVVLMPGDPLRAKWIAENFLTNAVQVNSVRGMLGFTGEYQGKRISVMAHGMGNPSIGIYSFELFNPEMYDVDVIIRIGSCGSLDPDLHVKDVVIGAETFGDSNYAQLTNIPTDQGVLKADPSLVNLANQTAAELNLQAHQTRCYASDVFYGVETYQQTAARTGAQVVEMEAFALYANALRLNKKALCLLTVSDSLVTHESMSAQERQTGFSNMVQLGLNIGYKLLS